MLSVLVSLPFDTFGPTPIPTTLCSGLVEAASAVKPVNALPAPRNRSTAAALAASILSVTFVAMFSFSSPRRRKQMPGDRPFAPVAARLPPCSAPRPRHHPPALREGRVPEAEGRRH